MKYFNITFISNCKSNKYENIQKIYFTVFLRFPC